MAQGGVMHRLFQPDLVSKMILHLHMEDVEEAPDSPPQTCSARAVAAVLEVNLQMEDYFTSCQETAGHGRKMLSCKR